MSKHMNVPTNQHWLCGRRVLYVQGSKALKLNYTKEANHDFVWESNAESSGDVNDSKLRTAYYFVLIGYGAALNAALSWIVMKQATVALFSSDAE